MDHRNKYQNNHYHYPDDLITLIEQNDGTVLSEDPLLPIVAHKSPYLADPFMLRIILEKNDSIKKTLLEDIARKDFSLIVFMFNPCEKLFWQGKAWYSEIHFGDEFTKTVIENYKPTQSFGNCHVYSPI